MSLDALVAFSQELLDVHPDIEQELNSIAMDIESFKKRGPQRKTRWRRRSPIKRRKRRRWERTPGGRAYLRKKERVERRPSTKRYRKRLHNRGVHRRYPWLKNKRR